MSPSHGMPLVGGIYPMPFREFISPKARKIIFWTVVGIHFVILVCPFLWSVLISFLTPPTLKVMKISLVDSPIPIDGPPSRNPSKHNKTPANAASIPDPGPIAPIPEPQPEPETKQDDTPKKEPKEPPKKEPSKVPSKDSKPAPEKKKLTADDIKNSGKVVKNDAKKPPKGQGGPVLDPNKLINAIKGGIYQPPGGGAGPLGELGNPNEVNEYYSRVASFLYGRWQQPNKELLGNAKPSVDVKVVVDASGRILSAAIVSKSGVMVMDSSVERLFAEVKSLPVPPKGMEFTIKMIITDD